MQLSPEALTRLVCPACHARLRLHDQSVLCTSCTRIYPVIDGLPILIPDRAIASPGSLPRIDVPGRTPGRR